MINNQKGVTLIELLAVLVLISVFIGIIYSVAQLAINYNKVETTRTNLQQEVNYIITKVQQVHRTADCYVLILDNNSVEIAESCKYENGKFQGLYLISNRFSYKLGGSEDKRLVFQVFPKGEEGDLIDFDNEFTVVEEDFVIDDFTVYDEQNNVEVTITTALTRYINTNREEETE